MKGLATAFAASSAPGRALLPALLPPRAPLRLAPGGGQARGPAGARGVGGDAPLEEVSRRQREAATRPPRFYVPPAAFPGAPGAPSTLAGQEAFHAVKVLRLREGSRVEVCDGEGRVALCEVAAVTRREATVVAVGAPEAVPWAGPKLELAVACGTLQGGRADWMVEKATELGAWAIRPLETERSTAPGGKGQGGRGRGGAREPGGGGRGREGRWDRLVQAANQQSLREHGTRLLPPSPVPRLVEAIRSADAALLAAAGGEPLAAAVGRLGPEVAGKGHILLIVGPPGDFTPEEQAAMAGAGAVPVGLGARRLRTETAAMALLASVQTLCDVHVGGGP